MPFPCLYRSLFLVYLEAFSACSIVAQMPPHNLGVSLSDGGYLFSQPTCAPTPIPKRVTLCVPKCWEIPLLTTYVCSHPPSLKEQPWCVPK